MNAPVDLLAYHDALIASHKALSADAYHVQELPKAEAARAAVAELIEAMRLQQRMNREALGKFNWGASALDANAIDLLNRAPAALGAALVRVGGAE